MPEDQYRVEAAIAVGRPADKAVLDEPYRSREEPNSRDPLERMVFEARLPPRVAATGGKVGAGACSSTAPLRVAFLLLRARDGEVAS